MNNAAKTVPRILRDNICTGFNALNLMIALVLAAVGAWRNLLFIFIILINTTVGIVQEIRAKRQIERLTLLLAVAVMRGGKEQRIHPEELRKGDAPLLAAGNAACTDCIWQEGRPEVNEAIPTGSGCADGGFPDWTEPFESLPDRAESDHALRVAGLAGDAAWRGRYPAAGRKETDHRTNCRFSAKKERNLICSNGCKISTSNMFGTFSHALRQKDIQPR